MLKFSYFPHIAVLHMFKFTLEDKNAPNKNFPSTMICHNAKILSILSAAFFPKEFKSKTLLWRNSCWCKSFFHIILERTQQRCNSNFLQDILAETSGGNSGQGIC